jgi:hypothetical protein
MAFLVSTKTDSRRGWNARPIMGSRSCLGRAAPAASHVPLLPPSFGRAPPTNSQDSQSLSNRDLTHDLRGWSITETLGFCTAGFAEIAKRVDQPAIRHLPQLWDSLVRLQIRIDNLFSDLVGAVDDPCRGQHAHSAYLRVKPHQAGNVWFVVLQRMDVQR